MSKATERRAGVVLCGGRSSRMGRAKAGLPWMGRTMIEHVVETLRPVVEEVVVVTAEGLDLPPLNARVVVDREAGRGPLGGIRDGLAVASSFAERAFVTSTDSPYLSVDFVESMFARGSAVAPRSEDRIQVLCAVYPCAAWKEADALLAQDRARPLFLLEALGFEAVDFDDPAEARPLAVAPRPWHGFNTPEEYLEIVRESEPKAGVTVEVLGRTALELTDPIIESPVGTLEEVLDRVPVARPLVEAGRVVKAHIVALSGRDLVRDARIPIGPGERITLLDAQAGG